MNSKVLFAKQVEKHARTLCDLLAAPSGATVSPKDIEHASITTRMLAGSARLMELGDLEAVLRRLERLFERYGEKGYRWDERIAEVTSEIIDKEETFVAGIGENPAAPLDTLIDGVELNALANEIAVLDEECENGLWPENNSEARKETTEPATGTDDTGTGKGVESGVPISGVIEEFERVSRELCARLNAYPGPPAGGGSAEDLLESVGKARFYIEAIDGFLERSRPGASRRCRADVLRSSITAYAAELCADTNGKLQVLIDCEEGLRVDDAILIATDSILQLMVHDIFRHSDGESIDVSIRAVERFGATHWFVSDNAGNLVSDSRLDHEDQLAFYPSLKRVIRIVGENHGLLWVEPDNGKESRFEFRLPETREPGVLHVWGNERGAFALRASQICEYLLGGPGSSSSDSHGEFVVHDGRRVPLVRLDTLYPEATADGSMIAVVGSVEKRVAFYVSKEGKPSEGTLNGNAFSAWEGQPPVVTIDDGTRVSLLDANDVVGRYLAATGTLTQRDMSGGAIDNDKDYIQSQAASKVDVTAPPDDFSAERPEEDGVQVLVVEQSESTREDLVSALAGRHIQVVHAGGADEAIGLLGSIEPKLIISEFRMPTMAAKRLADELRSRGRSIPVLVTTSQSGQTAETLVEKLGVSGYLSKPFAAAEVARQLEAHLGPRVGS